MEYYFSKMRINLNTELQNKTHFQAYSVRISFTQYTWLMEFLQKESHKRFLLYIYIYIYIYQVLLYIPWGAVILKERWNKFTRGSLNKFILYMYFTNVWTLQDTKQAGVAAIL
jgi:hypothetical protein